MTDGRHTIWTDAVIATLHAGAAAKMTASQIAGMIAAQHNVLTTRNAVIGKLTRAGNPPGLKLRVKKTPAPRPPQPKRPPPFARLIPRAPLGPPLSEKPPATPPVLAADGQPHTMLTLPAGACKWPVAGAGKNMQFCAHEAPQSGASPYCAHHHLKSIIRTTLPGEA